MHTESQARELWCPFVRHEGDAAGSFNRGWSPVNPLNKAAAPASESYLCNCIGSRCAAWRISASKSIPRTGYCGMMAVAPAQQAETAVFTPARDYWHKPPAAPVVFENHPPHYVAVNLRHPG